MTALLWMLYNINWFMFTVYSNTSEMENVYSSHNFHFKEIHTSCRMVLVLYWYIMAFNCQMSFMESVYCLHKSQTEKFIDSVYVFCLEVLSGKSPEIRTKYLYSIYLYDNALPIMYNTGFSAAGIHNENALIYLIYLFVIPMLLYSLVKPVLSVMVKVDRLSIRRKINNRCQPILWLCHYPSNLNRQKPTTKRNKNRSQFKKPPPLYHLTRRGRMYVGLKILLLYFGEVFDTAKQWMKEEVLHVYMQWLYVIEQSIFTRYKYNRAFVMSVLRCTRMILYATVSVKLTSSELLRKGTSTLSVIFLSGIILSMIVTIMESKSVEAVKIVSSVTCL